MTENMGADFWISQLGRLYQEADDHIDGTQGAAPLAEQFNQMLGNLQEKFPDNDFVQSLDEVSPGGRSVRGMEARQDAASNVRTKCGQLADALGYDLPEEDLRQDDSPMNVVKVESHQTATQSVEQTVTVESTMELVNHLSRDQETVDELHSIISEFEQELESEDPDDSLLREFIRKAGEKSPEVAANLGMLALQKGLISVLGL
ncbi:hypothetical protein GRS48_14010 [Halorubrum sp. JWXQ-INN 858]|uniref:hypothetical protein n=1 Tax=Halorubrum sp. JWXQ-INN 858 TaxID=2690782 RepID=UPI0013597389|nr:hypothetical protein [Halorubrum sp. JWXQ-INN 858]MWV65925.1 hypothetical protein [Halorubrum sp. JWXQ-INN 858]